MTTTNDLLNHPATKDSPLHGFVLADAVQLSAIVAKAFGRYAVEGINIEKSGTMPDDDRLWDVWTITVTYKDRADDESGPNKIYRFETVSMSVSEGGESWVSGSSNPAFQYGRDGWELDGKKVI